MSNSPAKIKEEDTSVMERGKDEGFDITDGQVDVADVSRFPSTVEESKTVDFGDLSHSIQPQP